MRCDIGGRQVARQVIPGDIDVQPSESCLILHYRIHVDIIDESWNVVASRTESKSSRIVFCDINKIVDLEAVADSLIVKYEALNESRRPQLIAAMMSLRKGEGNDVFALSARTPVDIPSDKVRDILRDALQGVHWGNENERLDALGSIVELAQLDTNLAIIADDEPLMNTLLNSLKKLASSSLLSCISIMTIFERMSHFKHFVQRLAKLKIGAMSLGMLHAQVALSNIAAQTVEREKLPAYMQSQNRLMTVTVSMLLNLSESPSTMRKMVHKDIMASLVAVLDRKSPDLLVMSLKLLRKIALVPVNWSDVPYDTICQVIVTKVFRWVHVTREEDRTRHIAVLREGIELLYVFSFHSDIIDEFKECDVFGGIAKMTDIVELRPQLIKVFYKCSMLAESDEIFRNDEILDIVIQTATSECEERIIALSVMMKLSLDRECSEKIARSPVFTSENLKHMFCQASAKQSNENRILLRMIRNVADSQPSLITGIDDEITLAVTRNRDIDDALCDIFSVLNRAKMTSDRAKLLVANEEFISVVMMVMKNAKSAPQLHLECVMFISSIVLYSTPAKIMEEKNVVECVVNAFILHKSELDIQAQCMFAFYRFICHTATRTALLRGPEIIDVIIEHSASRNAVLNFIGNSVLNALTTFDKSYTAKIKLPRFNTFNREWLSSVV